MKKIVLFLATGLYLGKIPFMPGTFGTLFGFFSYWFLPLKFFHEPLWLFAHLSFFFLGVYLCQEAEKQLGHDHKSIVFDEIVGYYCSVLFMPKTIVIAIYAFIFFRTFDIAKPFPVNKLQKLPGGWGIMVDDVLAGILANVLLRITIAFFPRFFLQI